MSRARWARARRHLRAAGPLVVVAAALILTSPALAGTTGGTSMPWETPLQTVQDSLAGPVAKAVGIIAIVITGLGFAFAEGGSAMRKGIGIVFGLAIAFTATTFISSFFNLTSGAVF
ncbi:TrbC/VirB2 family protein [Phenylobacterium montanum]|uniref:TrbC/VirB2 family protein n=1 Tax=Phenylobacterium montanum TaxID=2823693 RepID=A0A975G5G5_9CAUL|nr:TrbC/VirB2 family protein [Caulobacter sp. S6]QUD90924.1 TrbC/VirB2 family protein [Caulobacter sp. S6]